MTAKLYRTRNADYLLQGSGERKVCLRIQRGAGKLTREQLRIRSSCDHGGVVGGEGAARKEDVEAALSRLFFERAAKLAIGSDSTRNQNGARAGFFRCCERAGNQIAHHRSLKTGQERKRIGTAQRL